MIKMRKAKVRAYPPSPETPVWTKEGNILDMVYLRWSRIRLRAPYLDDIETEIAVPMVARNPIRAGAQEYLFLALVDPREPVVAFLPVRMRLHLYKYDSLAIAGFRDDVDLAA